ncbi:MAG: major capsid protein [Spirochaetaceae bacterium]|jgi:hypothetical protein|nr:major capsid protein [Spirochaetaceae bacterium]
MAEILTVTRALKITFEETRTNLAQFLSVFFPSVRIYAEREIPVDRIIQKPVLAKYREEGGASNLLAYVPGKGDVYTPPVLAESTPIDERMAHSVVAGLEANAGPEANRLRLLAQIQSQHDEMITRALLKQAADIMATGKFQPVGKDGAKVGKEFDFGRDAANTISANYSASPVKQWTDAYDQYKKKRGPLNNLVVIAGDNWLSAIEKNAGFQKAAELQGLNAGYSRLVGEDGPLAQIVEMKIPGRPSRCRILSFGEGYQNDDGAYEPFIDPDTIIFTSLNAPRIQIYAGIFLVENGGRRWVETGQLVSDTFIKKDPDCEVLRSQSAPLLVPGNVDHIVSAKTTTAYA